MTTGAFVRQLFDLGYRGGHRVCTRTGWFLRPGPRVPYARAFLRI